MTISLTKPTGPDHGPDRPQTTGPDRTGPADRTALHLVTADRPTGPAVDTTQPIRPEWLQTWDAFKPTAIRATKRTAYRTARFPRWSGGSSPTARVDCGG